METKKLKTAVVEDDRRFQTMLCGYLKRAGQEEGISCEIRCYADGAEFVNSYTPDVDLIFMDIELPRLNGMKAARRIRELDRKVGIVFVTNMAQYALQGYEVDAIDYILKPVEYFTFAYKFKKALRYCMMQQDKDVLLTQPDGMIRLPCSGIYYLEKDKNYILYHTDRGDFRERGTMTEREAALREDGFALCNSGVLVNLRHVRCLDQDTVWIGEKALPVSRNKRKAFVEKLMNYMRR